MTTNSNSDNKFEIPGLISWNELQVKEYATPLWLIQGLVPSYSDVLIWGKEGVGKNPIAWQMSVSYASGTDFFGYKVVKPGRVLMVEIDMQERLTHERIKRLPECENIMFGHLNPITTNHSRIVDKNVRDQLKQWNELWKPSLVIFDSLRKSHSEDDKQSDVPSKVYSMYRSIFPGSTNIFIHHEKKESTGEYKTPDSESFSGSKAWINDPNVAMRVSVKPGRQRYPVELKVIKNHLGQKGWVAANFRLTDGVFLESDRVDEAKLRNLVCVDRLEGSELVKATMESLGVSKSVAYDKLKEFRKRLIDEGVGTSSVSGALEKAMPSDRNVDTADTHPWVAGFASDGGK